MHNDSGEKGANALIKGSSQAGYGQARKNRDYTLALLRFIILAVVVIAAAVFLTPANFPGTMPEPWAIGSFYGIFLAALLVVFSIRKANEWERVIILRFGRFHKIREPGLYFLIPLADRAAETVDIRIRVTDFSAQETLTKDSVTVTVDALCFWLVWDPQKAILEVEDYRDAVILASKTALRDAVSSHDLSVFLERGDLIEKKIQEEV
ncbi:MAG: hypothetical protein LBT39_08120, partial [Treponema sp.]|nr:hypothetical protein [Treponema sp.]